jgi:hypothetical protein
VPGAIGTGSRPPIVIQDHTRGVDRHTILALLWPVAAWSDDHMYKRLPALPFGIYARYLLGSLRPQSIRNALPSSGSYRLATAEEVASYAEVGDRWHKLFPHSAGYFVFSVVGLGHDGTQALLHVDYICGLCVGGTDVFLRKVNGKWLVEAEASTWIS